MKTSNAAAYLTPSRVPVCRAQPARPGDTLTRWACAGLGIWCLMLAGYHWQPFDFGIDEGLVRQKVARLSLVPFAGYRSGSDLAAFNNLVAKVATALPFGIPLPWSRFSPTS